MRGAARAFNAAGGSPFARPFPTPGRRSRSSFDPARAGPAASSPTPEEDDELETACDCARAGTMRLRVNRHRAARNVYVIRRTPFTASRFGEVEGRAEGRDYRSPPHANA